MRIIVVSKQISHNYSAYTRTSDKKDPLSDNLIRRWLSTISGNLAAFYTEREWKTEHLQKMLIASRNDLPRSPRINTRQQACSCICPHTTIWNFLHNRLHLNAYKMP
ncbi:hypothetical protein AVEN_190030-1 [Araneus ventricosus]|uniref:Uncharacterized protein n=1 Tax=Araneus ventricosus TaxID=182803 RepID=A0A4Y2KWA5_ARAVE|nr:hypothetical protein AVEN_190030-1 [Araneus ventricosus]